MSNAMIEMRTSTNNFYEEDEPAGMGKTATEYHAKDVGTVFGAASPSLDPMGRLEEICGDRGYGIIARCDLPDFYIWLDLENRQVNISIDATVNHITEFIDNLYNQFNIAV